MEIKSRKIADAAVAATASVGTFLVFDTTTTCIFLNLDTKSCFTTPISDFSFIWSFSLPCRQSLAHFERFGEDGKGVRLFWAIFAMWHGGCNKCLGGGNLALLVSYVAPFL